MTYGFIGFGSMATMIIHCMIEYSKVIPRTIYVTRKNKDRLGEINAVFKDITVVNSCQEIMENAQMVFLCAKPIEIRDILVEIAPYVKDNTHIISIAGSVSIDNMQSILNGKITKYIPTITSEIGSGVSLICHNSHVTEEDAAFFEALLNRFGKVKRIREEDFRLAIELTSCMPGFIASIFSNLTNVALKQKSFINGDMIRDLIVDTLFATAQLLAEKDMSFEEVVARVATKGGITQEGVAVLSSLLPYVFDAMFDVTLDKRRITEEKIKALYETGSSSNQSIQ